MADTNRGVLRDTETLRERERERENERREAERDRLRELRREQERESERAKHRELESLREGDRQIRSMAGVPRTYNADILASNSYLNQPPFPFSYR